MAEDKKTVTVDDNAANKNTNGSTGNMERNTVVLYKLGVMFE